MLKSKINQPSDIHATKPTNSQSHIALSPVYPPGGFQWHITDYLYCNSVGLGQFSLVRLLL